MRTFLLCVALLVSLGWGALQWLQAADAKGVSRFQGALTGFYCDLLRTRCVTSSEVIQAAEARGWKVETDPARFSHLSAEQRRNRLVIHVEPPMPFSKEPGVAFRFGADGCLMG